ncbi:hypothetical protein [Clostridium intestinale]|uniref:Prophage protein n=1 Tax=Clostridium intestinale DSM 6191 TaxID=1121320 RepID=A0A1M5TZ90_9CLOT|nr:hypothetical protein [Clostridium intestinale]SHH56097.1 hypothetical protein SAMN02745941_00361 [Clostridium intestinale DSM 6191]
MLKLNKNITLNGVVEIDGVQAAYIGATINTDGINNTSVTKTITNQELYARNKAQVRADVAAFEAELYKTEDEVLISKTESPEGEN